MLNAMPVIYFLYAAALFGGGMMGFIQKHSVPSVIFSTIFAVIAIAAGVTTRNNANTGLTIGIIDALLVIGVFIYRYMKTHNAMPAFPAIGMSVIVIGLAVVALLSIKRPA